MDKFKLSAPLAFIKKEGLTEGYVEPRNGFYLIKAAGEFKQIITAKQYQVLLESSIVADEVVKPEVKVELAGQDESHKESPRLNSGKGTLRK